MTHCDDYIDDPNTPDFLRAFLAFYRSPATEKLGRTPPELYAVHNGVPVRVTMASRFGDVGITTRLDQVHGYSKRVMLSDLSNFSAERPVSPEKQHPAPWQGGPQPSRRDVDIAEAYARGRRAAEGAPTPHDLDISAAFERGFKQTKQSLSRKP